MAELIYHHSGGDAMRDGVSWFGRHRARLWSMGCSTAGARTSSLDPGRSTSALRIQLGTTHTMENAAGGALVAGSDAEHASAADEPQPATPQPASPKGPSRSTRTSPTRTSPTRVRIHASLAGIWGGAVPQPYTGVDRPMRRMRLRDELELPREITDDTVVYLSPHYRLLPASGTGSTGVQSNMYTELSAQLGSLGIKVVSIANATSSAEQRALFLLVLCPGFFSCPELVEETANALKRIFRGLRTAGFGTCRRLLSEAGAEGGAEISTEVSLSERSWQEDSSFRREGLKRRSSLGNQFSRLFRRMSGALMPLMSTAMPYKEYERTCPPDLKDLGLFEVSK